MGLTPPFEIVLALRGENAKRAEPNANVLGYLVDLECELTLWACDDRGMDVFGRDARWRSPITASSMRGFSITIDLEKVAVFGLWCSPETQVGAAAEFACARGLIGLPPANVDEIERFGALYFTPENGGDIARLDYIEGQAVHHFPRRGHA